MEATRPIKKRFRTGGRAGVSAPAVVTSGMSKGNPNPSPATRFSVAQQPKNGQHEKSPYSQAVEWQRRLNKMALTRKLTPHGLAMLSRAWKEQEEIKRKIRGVPDPKPIDLAALREEKRKAKLNVMMFAEMEDLPIQVPPEKPYEPTHEMRDMPGFPGAKICVAIDSPATPAVAEAKPTPAPDQPAPPALRPSVPPDDGLTPLGRAALAKQRATPNRASSPQIVRMTVGKGDVFRVGG